jgi:hypothetical protein
MLPKMCLRVEVKIPEVVEREELEDTKAMTEILKYKESSISQLCKGPKIGFNTG